MVGVSLSYLPFIVGSIISIILLYILLPGEYPPTSLMERAFQKLANVMSTSSYKTSVTGVPRCPPCDPGRQTDQKAGPKCKD